LRSSSGKPKGYLDASRKPDYTVDQAGVTPDELRETVKKVGPIVEDVARELGNTSRVVGKPT
jgi:hypothetical protein